MTYTLKERTDPPMQERETLVMLGNVVVRAGSTAMKQTSSRRVGGDRRLSLRVG